MLRIKIDLLVSLDVNIDSHGLWNVCRCSRAKRHLFTKHPFNLSNIKIRSLKIRKRLKIMRQIYCQVHE